MAFMIPLLASSVTRNLAVSLGVRNHQIPDPSAALHSSSLCTARICLRFTLQLQHSALHYVAVEVSI